MSRKTLRRPSTTPRQFHGIITVAPQMIAFFDRLSRVARSQASVLVRGETGTGKELAARALHRLSPRHDAPFRTLNCATLTPELLASELFGHVRGAYTGAIRDRKGLFELANQGTIFLDEIAEMPLELQARLLRVLQEQSFTPVGATEAVKVDVRVLSATHRALREEVNRGRFREDLMYRVRVVPLFLPRLANREGDVEALTWFFIGHFNKIEARQVEAIDAVAMEALRSYDWPGNVRELRNNIEYAFAIGEGPLLRLTDLTPELQGQPPASSRPRRSELSTQERERRRIIEALDVSGGRKGSAAEHLGISRSTLWRKLREYRIG